MKPAMTADAFWGWFAKALKGVAAKAYRRGWRDSELVSAHPDCDHPPLEAQQDWYTGSGFEPDFVRKLYEPPFGFTPEMLNLLRAAIEVLSQEIDWQLSPYVTTHTGSNDRRTLAAMEIDSHTS